MSDPLAEAVALLTRGHNLFTGQDPQTDIGGAAAGVSAHADRVAAITGRGGLPGAAQARSVAAVAGLQRLAGGDAELAAILAQARACRQHAAAATRMILDAAVADPIPGADTPLGRSEALRRMIARLRVQRGHVMRTRAEATVLAARLRQLLYQQELTTPGGGRDAAAAAASGSGGTGRAAVRAAIHRALDIKGIFDPVARARWEHGMMLVAARESNFNANAVNHWDSNAAKGTPSQGAFQFVEATFARFHEPGTSPHVRNLVSQACAFLNYAHGHYGVSWDGSNLADRIQQADPRRGPRGY